MSNEIEYHNHVSSSSLDTLRILHTYLSLRTKELISSAVSLLDVACASNAYRWTSHTSIKQSTPLIMNEDVTAVFIVCIANFEVELFIWTELQGIIISVLQ